MEQEALEILEDIFEIGKNEEEIKYCLANYIYQELEEGKKTKKQIIKDVKDYMKSVKDEDEDEIILNAPNMKEFHEKIEYYLELQQKEIKTIEGQMKCRFCKSHSTTYTTKQMRRADESASYIVFCNSCGKRDVIG